MIPDADTLRLLYVVALFFVLDLALFIITKRSKQNLPSLQAQLKQPKHGSTTADQFMALEDIIAQLSIDTSPERVMHCSFVRDIIGDMFVTNKATPLEPTAAAGDTVPLCRDTDELPPSCCRDAVVR